MSGLSPRTRSALLSLMRKVSRDNHSQGPASSLLQASYATLTPVMTGCCNQHPARGAASLHAPQCQCLPHLPTCCPQLSEQAGLPALLPTSSQGGPDALGSTQQSLGASGAAYRVSFPPSLNSSFSGIQPQVNKGSSQWCRERPVYAHTGCMHDALTDATATTTVRSNWPRVRSSASLNAGQCLISSGVTHTATRRSRSTPAVTEEPDR
jgi:hypothetical protein